MISFAEFGVRAFVSSIWIPFNAKVSNGLNGVGEISTTPRLDRAARAHENPRN